MAHIQLNVSSWVWNGYAGWRGGGGGGHMHPTAPPAYGPEYKRPLLLAYLYFSVYVENSWQCHHHPYERDDHHCSCDVYTLEATWLEHLSPCWFFLPLHCQCIGNELDLHWCQYFSSWSVLGSPLLALSWRCCREPWSWTHHHHLCKPPLT